MSLEDDLRLVYGEGQDSRLLWQAAARLEARFPPGDPLHEDISTLLASLVGKGQDDLIPPTHTRLEGTL